MGKNEVRLKAADTCRNIYPKEVVWRQGHKFIGEVINNKKFVRLKHNTNNISKLHKE